jgi:glycine/D-amino acid oxidase-like deaminating enzyme
MISPEEVKSRAPVLNCDDIIGGLWSPHDGQINPVDACMTVAAAAKRRCVGTLGAACLLVLTLCICNITVFH